MPLFAHQEDPAAATPCRALSACLQDQQLLVMEAPQVSSNFSHPCGSPDL
jgi:hypothetical protein